MTDILTEGQVLAHYRIVFRLGAGAMGEVYKAYDTNLERPVALKVLPADYVEDKAHLRRFIQEAKAASALNHPHIITIYEIGNVKLPRQPSESSKTEISSTELGAESTERSEATSVDFHYIAMEFVDGETLDKKIHQDRTDLKELLDYLAQVADGLAAAHAAGIVHRDLKPENIMIRRDGYAKLLDFGVAKLSERRSVTGTVVESGPAGAKGTEQGTFVGTVGYMSPEQVRGKSVDHRSDIFSFGCILYETVARRRAFKGEEAIDTLYKILHQETSALEAFPPGLPPGLEQIVRRCLAKEPDDRYSSLAEVAARLKEIRKAMEQLAPVRVSSGAIVVADLLKKKLERERSSSFISKAVFQPEQIVHAPIEVQLRSPSRKWHYLGLALGVAILIAVGVILLGPSKGTIQIESKPSGANVYVDDKLWGTTPLPPIELAPGSYRVRLEVKGYKSEAETVEVARKSTVTRSYILTPEEPPTREPTLTRAGIEVKHSHFLRRDCSGSLFFDGRNIEYKTSGPHSFRISLDQLIDLKLSRDKIVIEGNGVPGAQIQLQQLFIGSRPNLADFSRRVRQRWR